MYTSGIRKVFTSNNATTMKAQAEQAEQCGYTAMSFNGVIFIKVSDYNNESTVMWQSTCFNINDFTDKEV